MCSFMPLKRTMLCKEHFDSIKISLWVFYDLKIALIIVYVHMVTFSMYFFLCLKINMICKWFTKIFTFICFLSCTFWSFMPFLLVWYGKALPYSLHSQVFYSVYVLKSYEDDVVCKVVTTLITLYKFLPSGFLLRCWSNFIRQKTLGSRDHVQVILVSPTFFIPL